MTCHIWQVCCICLSVLYFPELGQIQHICAFEVYNIEIKVHFPFDLTHTKYNKALYPGVH